VLIALGGFVFAFVAAGGFERLSPRVGRIGTAPDGA